MFQKIAIATHPRYEELPQLVAHIAEYLRKKDLEVVVGVLSNLEVEDCGFDLFIALGGDGTMLRAGHICSSYGIPILGINLGRFGFLTEIGRDDWKKALDIVFHGEFRLEERMMLEVSQWRDGQKIRQWEALNEAVISRGKFVRPIQLDVEIDNRLLSTYVADGIIVSTPTGSTAYAMAAGGPILLPELRNILLVPLAPHLSIEQAVVLAEDSLVSIAAHTYHEAVLSIDGQTPIELKEEDVVNIKASEHGVQFIRLQDPGYFYRNLTPHMSRNPSIGKTNE